MRVLLDTHVLLWALADPQRLEADIRVVIESAAAEVLFSAASIWEIAIKSSRGRPGFSANSDEIAGAAIRAGFAELTVCAKAAALVATLPYHHRDPFDRILIAQAMLQPAFLYTADRILSAYSDLVRHIDRQ